MRDRNMSIHRICSAIIQVTDQILTGAPPLIPFCLIIVRCMCVLFKVIVHTYMKILIYLFFQVHMLLFSLCNQYNFFYFKTLTVITTVKLEEPMLHQ